jgi:hypothetical protein
LASLNSNPEYFDCFTLSMFRVENRVCLSHGVQVTGAACRTVMRIVLGVGDMVQRTGDGQAHVGYSMVGQSRGQVTPCVVCTVHEETRSAGFLIEPQNQGRRFVSGLASKPVATVSPNLVSKPVVSGFPLWALKPAAKVW